MNLLLHICCAPCSTFPVKELKSDGLRITGYFNNHNIHPYQEYIKRLEAVRQYADHVGLDVIYETDYRLEEFLKAVASAPFDRCAYCYASRLEAAAMKAAEEKFDAFTSTLLYSRYQKHDLIHALGKRIASKYGISFYYRDFRTGWREGIDLSKQMGLYRQQYCGCIYSEKERYFRTDTR